LFFIINIINNDMDFDLHDWS